MLITNLKIYKAMKSEKIIKRKLKEMSFEEMTFEQKVIATFRLLRKSKKITLDKIYKDTGIHLARIESNNYNITLSTLNKLCNFIEVDTIEFLKTLK